MAIKGKQRRTRGRRVVAAPPRPTLVVRKPPLWRRRWVWAAVGAVAAVAILVVVLVKLHDSHERALKAKEKAAVSSFFTALQRRFPADRQLIPPDLPSFYPNLSQDLTNLGQGTVKDADALAEATRVSATAAKAASSVEAMKLARFFPPSFEVTGNKDVNGRGATLATLQDAQFLMSESFQLFGQVGDLMRQAVPATGPARAALVKQSQSLLTSASSLFDRGYQKFLQIRQQVGLPTLNPASGVRPGRPLPTIAPSPSASP